MQIRKATRKQLKLRLALCGVAGSGKTLGSLKVAGGLGGKFVVIDTENMRSELFLDRVEFEFDVLQLVPPFTADRYIEAIKMCEKAGYQTIVIDSLSHCWAGSGGLLEINHNITQASKSKNSYTAWGEVTPMHNRLLDAIINSSCHIIATMRSKTHHDLMQIDNKLTPVKMGLAPIQRDGVEYEFDIVLEMDHERKTYGCSKDRTELFQGKTGMLTEDTGKILIEWLDKGLSFEEVKKQSLDEYASKIMNAATEDELRLIFSEAQRAIPSSRNELVVFKDKRKQELSIDGQIATMQDKMSTYAELGAAH